MTIKVGSIVRYWGAGAGKACAAIVADVNMDGTLNLAWFYSSGAAANITNVPLVKKDEKPPDNALVRQVTGFAEEQPE